MIRAQNLTKGFYQGNQQISVIKNLYLEVKAGEMIAIVGQSGSGKSTLLSLLSLLDSPDQGEIFFGTENLTGYNQTDRTRFRGQNVGVVFQQFHLVQHLSALENVALPLVIQGREGALEKAKALLDRVGLKHRMDHKPSQLSGGESQRVALARALIHEPKLLLADEPSGNLDVHTAESVMNLFFEVARSQNAATILVTHDLNLAKRCPRILTLKDGSLCS